MTELVDKRDSAQTLRNAYADLNTGGFDFDNKIRNEMLSEAQFKINNDDSAKASSVLPSAWKTGTTIVGICYKDGVCLGADTRATGGAEVVDKDCEKIHYLAPNIWCCGAGTAADTEKTTELMASNLELLRLSTGTQSRVVTANTMLKRMLYRYQGHVSAALVLGGMDINGPQLYSIHPHGSTQKLPYTTMGSGSLAAMAVFEARYKEDMSEAEAIEIVRDAIRAGIFNDLGSGSNVDVTVIRQNDYSRYRTYENAAGDANAYKAKYTRPTKIVPPKGTTFVFEESFTPHKGTESSTLSSGVASMDIQS
jgi:20S proteasome subunit beta 2